MTYTFFEPCNFLAESGVQSAQRDSVSPRCAEGIIANPVCEWLKLRGVGFQMPFQESCGVEVWRGGLGGAYRLPTLSVAGASLFPPCFRFHTPLIGRVEG